MPKSKPPLRESRIIAWAKAHRRRHGRFPSHAAGKVVDAPGESWAAINQALRIGARGLPGGSSLSRLLDAAFNRTRRLLRPPLTVEQILGWAKDHRRRSGRWPNCRSGPVTAAPDENWASIDNALKSGRRGLPAKSSLAKLLADCVGRRPGRQSPRLSDTKILKWADHHHRQAGRWPTCDSGKVLAASDESWGAIDHALKYGSRGLKPGRSLSVLLAKNRKVRRRVRVTQKLTVRQILKWADDHHRRNGHWPRPSSGRIDKPPYLSWNNIDTMLRRGASDAPAGMSIQRLLRSERGAAFRVRNRTKLSIPAILTWADEFHRRTGRWPQVKSGPIKGQTELTWSQVSAALQYGYRGLPKSGSLALLLHSRRGVTHPNLRPRLTGKQIVRWARAHQLRTGDWPRASSGPIADADHETWQTVDRALRAGIRGLPGKSSLCKLVNSIRPDPTAPRGRRPALKTADIIRWAEAHHDRTGEWPRASSGRVADAPGESWSAIAKAMQSGIRGQRKGQSLPRLLRKTFGAGAVARKPVSPEQIVTWAKRHHAETGRWPSSRSGPVIGAPGESWTGINSALKGGCRGLPGGDSVAQFLARHVGRRRGQQIEALTDEMILKWAHRHHRAHGRWPTSDSGPVVGTSGERWGSIDKALREGYRDLRPGRSLARLLDTIRGNAADQRRKRPLQVNDIILWVRAYHRRMGKWPDPYCGRILDARGETWFGVDLALRNEWRGLSGPKSLHGLVAKLRKPKPLQTRRRFTR